MGIERPFHRQFSSGGNAAFENWKTPVPAEPLGSPRLDDREISYGPQGLKFKSRPRFRLKLRERQTAMSSNCLKIAAISITESIVGPVEWIDALTGFVRCP